DVAREVHASRELVHAVQHAQKRGLAAVCRADDAEDLVFLDLEVDAGEHGLSAVRDRQVAHTHLDFGVMRSRFHHFFLPRRYMRNAIDAAFITSTMPISTSATP